MAPDLGCYSTAGNNLLTCVLDDAVAAFGGQAVFGLIVGSAILFSLWWANDGRIGVPAVVVLVSAGLMLPLLPAQYATIARAFAFIGLVAAIIAVGQRYFLDPNI